MIPRMFLGLLELLGYMLSGFGLEEWWLEGSVDFITSCFCDYHQVSLI